MLDLMLIDEIYKKKIIKKWHKNKLSQPRLTH
jgi:hypothetical protein